MQQPPGGWGDPLVIRGARALLLGLLVQHLLHPPALLNTAGEKSLPTVTRVRNGLGWFLAHPVYILPLFWVFPDGSRGSPDTATEASPPTS